jgi:hypothetical protein
MSRIIRCTKPSRGRARRDEDENDEKTDGLDRPPVRLPPRPPPSPPKKDGAECREWWVEKPDLCVEYPDFECVGDRRVGDRRRT